MTGTSSCGLPTRAEHSVPGSPPKGAQRCPTSPCRRAVRAAPLTPRFEPTSAGETGSTGTRVPRSRRRPVGCSHACSPRFSATPTPEFAVVGGEGFALPVERGPSSAAGAGSRRRPHVSAAGGGSSCAPCGFWCGDGDLSQCSNVPRSRSELPPPQSCGGRMAGGWSGSREGGRQSAECAEEPTVDPGQCRVWVVSA